MLRTLYRHKKRVASLFVPMALLIHTPLASAQTPTFDFGDGRHGSFTVPAGVTTIQDLWSQIRLGSDATAYNPNDGAQVPALENLTLSSGSTLTVSAYAGNPLGGVNPTEGGVLRLKVRGTLTIPAGAAITATGRGYRGGTTEGAEPGRIGQQGDTWGSVGSISGEANRGGGGGGFGEVSGGNNPGAGGGGGHREPGARGTTGMGADTSGIGGASFDTVATSLGQVFRDTYPFPRFGSGGGRGGQVMNFVSIGSLGGNGGGVIIIEAQNIVNEGAITADGAEGGSDLSGGGGGAGGSVWIQSLSTENGAVSVDGGAGGVGTVLGNDGGAGGPGILLWDARFSLSTAINGPGSIGLAPEGGVYNADTEVTLTATPEAGSVFDHWEGDITGSENPTKLVMNGDKSVTAFFVSLPALAVSPTTRNVGPEGGPLTFNVDVSGNTGDVNWTTAITSGSEFVTLSEGASGTNDDTITVNVAVSVQAEPRTATLLVSSDDVGSEPVILTIEQSAAVPTLSVTAASTIANAEGDEIVVQVRNTGTGTFDWNAVVLAGTGFASISSGATGTNNGTFVVSFLENTSVLQRTATLSVTAPGAVNSPLEVEIVQQAGVPLLQVTPSTQLLGSAAGNASINVTNGGNGTLNWTASVVEGGSFAAISDNTSGTNSGLVTVTLTRNPGTENRVVTIRVESGDATNSPVEVTITQTAQESVLEVTPEIQTTGSAAGAVSFQVQNVGTGTMNWTASVTSGANFISISDGISGNNDGVITVSVSENTSTLERTGTIQVQAPGSSNSPRQVTIVQTPRTPVLRVVPAEQTVGSGGGPVNISIENGGSGALNWTASFVTGAQFLSFAAAANGSGDGSLQVIAAPNDTEESRSGTIRIEAPGAEGSPQIATITQLGCVLLLRPSNVAASDGIHANSVELLWSATPGATQYEIFRSPSGEPDRVELIGTSTEPRYSDTLAKSPDYELINRGCFNPGEFIITNVIYFYFVKAINDCGTSELSLGTTGYRGLPQDGVPTTETAALVDLVKSERFTETVMPNARMEDGVYLLQEERTVAFRLTSDVAIDPQSLWAEIAGEAVGPDALTWVADPEDNTVGWVVITVPGSIEPGDAFSAVAGGVDVTGQTIAAVAADFYRGDVGAAKRGSDAQLMPYAFDEDSDGLFLEGKGAVLTLSPRAVYAEAQQVWIPIPENTDPANLALYYYGDGPLGGAWYPAENVTGWLARPDVEISADGSSLGYWLNHGGTFRLGVRPAIVTTSAGMAPSHLGTLVALGLTCLILMSTGRKRRTT